MAQKTEWHKLAQKALPFVLVVVLACAITLTFLGNQNTQVLTELERLFDWKFIGQASMEGTRAELEAEKLELQTKQQELAAAMTQTELLLSQLNTIKQDTQDLLLKAEQEGGAVSDKIGQLQEALDHVQELEQQRWVLPIQYTMCTSDFGYRLHPVKGEGLFHSGVDLAAPQGTPIVAARSGTVDVAAYEEDGAGYYVIIDHLDGYETRYFHMDRYIVTKGQFVVAGQIIGYCGSTGVATGSHLHFGVYQNNQAVDPGDYIDIY